MLTNPVLYLEESVVLREAGPTPGGSRDFWRLEPEEGEGADLS